jgi:hypothetical protein
MGGAIAGALRPLTMSKPWFEVVQNVNHHAIAKIDLVEFQH